MNWQKDDLQYKGLYIYQAEGKFRYGTDAVLLANYACADLIKSGVIEKNLRKNQNSAVYPYTVLDAGTGTGIIPILMCGKLTEKNPFIRFKAVEIQHEMAEMAQKSVEMNGQADRITVLECDIRNRTLLEGSSADCITVNPPYVRMGSGIKSENSDIAIARHETVCTQEEIFAAVSRILKVNGLFYSVNSPDRLADEITALRSAGIEPREIVFVHDSLKKNPVMFLLKGVKSGGRNLVVKPPLELGGKGASPEILNRLTDTQEVM